MGKDVDRLEEEEEEEDEEEEEEEEDDEYRLSSSRSLLFERLRRESRSRER